MTDSATRTDPPPVVAIDGPAASGKSSVARRLAAAMSIDYVNTGEMYRAVTWAALRDGVDIGSETAVAAWVATLELECRLTDGRSVVLVEGQDPADRLSDDGVNRGVSFVARVPLVRQILVDWQRRLGRSAAVVMEGRDIGTVVFPATRFKFYIDASEQVRARRRQAQGITDTVTMRDRMDSSRKNAPLKVAEGACVIDSSELGLDEVVARVLRQLAAWDYPADLLQRATPDS